MTKTNAEHQKAYRDRRDKYIAELEDRVATAYKIGLSMIGDQGPIKLKKLLDTLECRDLLRRRRRREIPPR